MKRSAKRTACREKHTTSADGLSDEQTACGQRRRGRKNREHQENIRRVAKSETGRANVCLCLRV